MTAGFPGPPDFREKLSWCFFDFANSSYTTVITTVVYARYFVGAVVPKDGYLGLPGDIWWAAAGALSQILVIITAPLLGAMADRAARKKEYLFRAYAACVLATALLTLSRPGWVLPAFVLVVAGNVAFFCGENLIAGFLPELAAKEEMGRLSGLGWTIGYFGGLLSLAAALPFATEALTPWTCLTTAVFFAVAGLPTFLFLKERAVPLSRDHCERLVRMAFGRTLDTWRERRIWRDLFTFLVSILLFQGGVAVVIAFSAIYAEQDMGLSKTEVILLFLALQIAAALGAWSFGRLQDHFGSKPTLILAIGLWMAAVLGVWLSQGPGLFVAASVLAGIAMGSSQSASRALVGLFCPYGREAEWFGLWGLATKGAACLGLLLFIGLRTLGDRRESLLSATVLLFACGLIVLLKVDVERGRKAAIEQGRAASFPGER